MKRALKQAFKQKTMFIASSIRPLKTNNIRMKTNRSNSVFRFWNTKTKLLILSTTLVLGIIPTRANVQMPAIFGDHMVLQQSIKLPVWGKADPGEKITVTIGTRTGTTTADNTGKWRINLDPLKSTLNAVIMTVSGKNTITFSDVLIGDVWACSGQSNMEYGISSTSYAKEDIPKAKRPLLRLFIVNKVPSFLPKENYVTDLNPKSVLVGHWQVCTPEMLVGNGGWPNSFSAVAYYFGSEIQDRTGLPVGLIQCPWGGKPIESFISLDALKKDTTFKSYVALHEKEKAESPALKAAAAAGKADFDAKMKAWNEQYGAAYKAEVEEWTKAEAAARAAHATLPPRPKPSVPMPTSLPDGNPKPDRPTHLFNGMIHTVIPYGIKGVIWYQGEQNVSYPWDYDKLMATLIGDWRTRWGLGDFPFLFVQLAAFQTPTKLPVEKDGWQVIREMQLRSLKVPNTGMAVTIDIGEANDIHPGDKRDVGHRLALLARQLAYGEKIESSGPLYQGMKVEENKIRIRFKFAKGLKIGAHPQIFPDVLPSAAPAELPGFAIAGSDKKWVFAKAVIEGETIVVSSDQVKEPVAVRYGWAKNPPCYLYNGANLPASPFRTDDWSLNP
ncbi:MAG: sialate O-acetylesterase [Paludibacter sp.]